MMHLSDDEILQLAEVAEEHLVFTNDQLEMMAHLKTCESCYKKFCGALTILEVTGDYGSVYLSELYEMKYARSLPSHETVITLAVLNLIKQNINEKKGMVLEQVTRAGDIFKFRPAVSVATRSTSAASASIYKLEDITDEKTFVAVDPARRELLLQINTSNLCGKKIKVFLQSDSGQNSEIHMEPIGNIYKGRAFDIPNEEARLVIQAFDESEAE